MKFAATPVFYLVCVVLLASGSSRADDDLHRKANRILERVSKLESFGRDEPRRKREVSFRLVREGQPDIDGVVTIKTDSASRWREDIDFDNYHSSELRIQDYMWTKSTHDFLPLVVEEISIALRLPFLRMRSQNSVKRIYDREIEGARVQCIEFETAYGDSTSENEVCVQKDSGFLMWARHGTTTAGFSEFLPIGEIVLPRDITIDLGEKGKIVGELHEEFVRKFDPSDFTPPDGAEMTDVCVKGSAPTPLYTPNLAFNLMGDLGISHGRIMGVLKVDADGNVVNVAVVQSPNPKLGDLALSTVRRWRYKPATCNGKPVKAVTPFSVTW